MSTSVVSPLVHAPARAPRRELQFLVPVQMDDGTRRAFRGVRAQHNDARGVERVLETSKLRGWV